MRQPEIEVHCAIQPRDVVIPVCAVDIGGQRAGRRAEKTVLLGSWSSARYEVDQALVIAVVRERQVGYFLGIQLNVDVRFVGLQQRSARCDRDLFRCAADRELHVDARHFIDRGGYIGARELPEIGSGHFQFVAARQHIAQRILAGFARRGFARLAGSFTADLDGCAGDDSPTLIFDRSDDRSVENLRTNRCD